MTSLSNLTTSDIFTILAVIIALSAYTGVVRQRLIDAINRLRGSIVPEEIYERIQFKTYLKYLSIGDILLIFSLVCFAIAWILKIINLKLAKTSFEHWSIVGVCLFLLGIFLLISLHIVEWFKSFDFPPFAPPPFTPTANPARDLQKQWIKAVVVLLLIIILLVLIVVSINAAFFL